MASLLVDPPDAPEPGADAAPDAGPDAGLGAALAVLQTALDHCATQTGPGDAEDLAAIRTALSRIAARHAGGPLDPLPGDDPARLDRLLAIAGPQDAPELLRRIIADLARAARQIETALPARDQAALRGASHVLIAVAGSVGALALERDARQLNTLAHDPAPAAGLDPVARQVLAGIDRLNSCLTRRHAGVSPQAKADGA